MKDTIRLARRLLNLHPNKEKYLGTQDKVGKSALLSMALHFPYKDFKSFVYYTQAPEVTLNLVFAKKKTLSIMTELKVKFTEASNTIEKNEISDITKDEKCCVSQYFEVVMPIIDSMINDSLVAYPTYKMCSTLDKYHNRVVGENKKLVGSITSPSLKGMLPEFTEFFHTMCHYIKQLAEIELKLGLFLRHAAAEGDGRFVTLFLDVGVDVNAAGKKSGKTAIDRVAESDLPNKASLIALLVLHGATSPTTAAPDPVVSSPL